jgi:hypothetical protein
MKIKTDTYETVSAEYDNAISWMIKLGVKISSGRTQHYKKMMDYWRENYKTASDEKAKDIFPDFVSSVSEIHDFIDIYNAFKEEPVGNLASIKNKLQKGVNGPLRSSDETQNSSEARNFVFEALVAAKFHHPKKEITTILSASSDTGVKVKSHKIWIECKRVTSENNLENNIRKASNQLDKQIRKKITASNKGLIAIDFSKILHNGDKLLVKENDFELQNSVQEITETLIKQYSYIWQNIYGTKNEKIIGTLVHFATMATSEERKLLVRVSDWGVNPKVNTSFHNQSLLKSIANNINNKT